MVAPLNVYQEKMLETTYAKDIIHILDVSVHGKNLNSRLMILGFQAVLFVMDFLTKLMKLSTAGNKIRQIQIPHLFPFHAVLLSQNVLKDRSVKHRAKNR
uniref:Uncharacterized protein n=1 Tax=Acrobeloides nanus TaxID=290746 RepID=A0A914DU57_9BILA